MALSLAPGLASANAALTEMEIRWLKAAGPVLAYAKNLGLPIDIIVQPVTRSNDVPLAMGFMEGRCKLVLSMRGNPDAEKVLDKVPSAQHAVLMEAMAAHEVGHCWRYAQGVWHQLPSGFVESGDEHAHDPSLLAAARTMRENRREEGYADMVALAWTKRHHPGSYAQVYHWLHGLREEVAVPGSGHDTRAWVRLASNPEVFPVTATPFQDASEPWSQGLLRGH
ncbi:hypothetical protein KY495_13995 [Massilia sp. PAMC28688]|nr:hypothetical protein KY495_13995 [Massilia sp. PAMC28688]